MNSKKINAALLVTSLIGISLGSCKKRESPDPAKDVQNIQPSSTMMGTTNLEGIKSWRYIANAYTIEFPYYQLVGPIGMGFTAATGGYEVSVNSPKAYGASGGINIFVYQHTNGAWFINRLSGNEYILVNAGTGTIFNDPIEEIEIDPATGETYAIVRKLSSINLYHLDQNTGVATSVGILFNSPNGNRYKSGSITFVPNSSGGYNMAYTHESGVYAANGLTMWIFNVTSTTMSIVASYTFPTSGIPGAMTGNLNTTYGNGKFYIARDGGNLYSLPYSISTGFTSGSAANLELNASAYENKFDFGYGLRI